MRKDKHSGMTSEEMVNAEALFADRQQDTAAVLILSLLFTMITAFFLWMADKVVW